MIEKIRFSSVNTKQNTPSKKDSGESMKQPSFGGLPAMGMAVVNGLMHGVQVCEKSPMINVSVLDFATAILPRTYFETVSGSKKKDENGNVKREYNAYAGMEAFRREGSGLVVNCLIPSAIVAGIAYGVQRPIMGQFGTSNLSTTWANGAALDKIHHYYNVAEGQGRDKVYHTFKNMFNNLEGVDGDVNKDGLKKFKDLFSSKPEADKALNELTDLVFADAPKRTLKQYLTFKNPRKEAIRNAYEKLVKITNISENIRFVEDKGKFFSNNFESLTSNTIKVLRNVVKEEITDDKLLEKYFSKAKNLVNVKSAVGLLAIIPLAISMQPINRWITRKTSGKSGAPIYNDFKEREVKELTPQEKAQLLRQKFVSIGSMIGLSLLSMMKLPTWNMFQFSGKFPTMDQARLISTATFASRMGAAEDTNELREATVRDIVTFSSLYFLGDYAAKGIATLMEHLDIKKNGDSPTVHLLNRLADKKENANAFQKLWDWVKHTSLKSTDELATVKDKNLRTICQLGNLAFSLIALGVFIPVYTRTKTNKKEKERLEQLTKENAETASSSTGAGAAASKTASSGTSTSKSSSKISSDEFTGNIVKDGSTTFKAFFNS